MGLSFKEKGGGGCVRRPQGGAWAGVQGGGGDRSLGTTGARKRGPGGTRCDRGARDPPVIRAGLDWSVSRARGCFPFLAVWSRARAAPSFFERALGAALGRPCAREPRPSLIDDYSIKLTA